MLKIYCKEKKTQTENPTTQIVETSWDIVSALSVLLIILIVLKTCLMLWKRRTSLCYIYPYANKFGLNKWWRKTWAAKKVCHFELLWICCCWLWFCKGSLFLALFVVCTRSFVWRNLCSRIAVRQGAVSLSKLQFC